MPTDRRTAWQSRAAPPPPARAGARGNPPRNRRRARRASASERCPAAPRGRPPSRAGGHAPRSAGPRLRPGCGPSSSTWPRRSRSDGRCAWASPGSGRRSRKLPSPGPGRRVRGDRSLDVKVESVSVPAARGVPRFLQGGEKVGLEAGEARRRLQRERPPAGDVVPAEHKPPPLAQGLVAGREGGLRVVLGIQTPAEHAVAEDEVEIAGREMSLEVLDHVGDVAGGTVPRSAPGLVDRPVLPVRAEPSVAARWV